MVLSDDLRIGDSVKRRLKGDNQILPLARTPVLISYAARMSTSPSSSNGEGGTNCSGFEAIEVYRMACLSVSLSKLGSDLWTRWDLRHCARIAGYSLGPKCHHPLPGHVHRCLHEATCHGDSLCLFPGSTALIAINVNVTSTGTTDGRVASLQKQSVDDFKFVHKGISTAT